MEPERLKANDPFCGLSLEKTKYKMLSLLIISTQIFFIRNFNLRNPVTKKTFIVFSTGLLSLLPFLIDNTLPSENNSKWFLTFNWTLRSRCRRRRRYCFQLITSQYDRAHDSFIFFVNAFLISSQYESQCKRSSRSLPLGTKTMRLNGSDRPGRGVRRGEII